MRSPGALSPRLPIELPRFDSWIGIPRRSQATTGMTHGGDESRPFRVRLPGFISEEEVGLGDVIKGVTYVMGIKPCEGCERRAAALNRWMVFTR